MKKLRILTGRHVGAAIELPVGISVVGPGADCDITISDWTFAPLRLQVSAAGVEIAWSEPEADGKAGAQGALAQSGELGDFQPREFDGTVICVGPVEGEWPSDVALLDVVFRPTPQRVARWAGAKLKTRRIAMWSAAAAAVVVASLSGVMLSAGAKVPPAPVYTLAQTQARLQMALEAIAPKRLQVKTERNSIVVEGLVDAPEQAAAARQAIESARGAFAAVPRFSVAGDVAEAIRSAVGQPNATVKHTGEGVFSYVADTADPRATRAALDRVAADLAPAVKRIDATLEEQVTEPKVRMLSNLQTDSVSVMQTRDGVKHLVVRPPVASITNSQVLSLTPPASGQWFRNGDNANPPKE
jgi:type III secretion protein D